MPTWLRPSLCFTLQDWFICPEYIRQQTQVHKTSANSRVSAKYIPPLALIIPLPYGLSLGDSLIWEWVSFCFCIFSYINIEWMEAAHTECTTCEGSTEIILICLTTVSSKSCFTARFPNQAAIPYLITLSIAARQNTIISCSTHKIKIWTFGPVLGKTLVMINFSNHHCSEFAGYHHITPQHCSDSQQQTEWMCCWWLNCNVSMYSSNNPMGQNESHLLATRVKRRERNSCCCCLAFTTCNWTGDDVDLLPVRQAEKSPHQKTGEETNHIRFQNHLPVWVQSTDVSFPV